MSVDRFFFFPRTPVSVVSLGDIGSEDLLVTLMLESMGASVTRHLPGTPGDFLQVLSQGEHAPSYLIICGHGDENGFVFGDYGEGIDISCLVDGSLPASQIAENGNLPNSIVISTCCNSGTMEMGKAFLHTGVSAYIAPDDYPDGNDICLFLHQLLHRILVRKQTIAEAHGDVLSLASEYAMFRLYQPTEIC